MNQLEQLKKHTIVVADSGDIESIREYHPEDATTNPSLILKAANLPQYYPLFNEALDYACTGHKDKTRQVISACDRLAVNIGCEILKIVPGRISTEVDARLSFDTHACVEKAHKIIDLYASKGIDKSRVLIKLASTWEGIRAGEILQKDGINCNLTLLFSFAQARAAAEAGVFLISPFVGRIYDWYQSKFPGQPYDISQDPGVVSVRNIYRYYKQHKFDTVIMGASFRKVEQILALSGCDRLTIAPNLLAELKASAADAPLQLEQPSQFMERQKPISVAEYRWELNEDAMATEKLAEGIRNFAIDQRKLEQMLASRLG